MWKLFPFKNNGEIPPENICVYFNQISKDTTSPAHETKCLPWRFSEHLSSMNTGCKEILESIVMLINSLEKCLTFLLFRLVPKFKREFSGSSLKQLELRWRWQVYMFTLTLRFLLTEGVSPVIRFPMLFRALGFVFYPQKPLEGVKSQCLSSISLANVLTAEIWH